MRLETERLVLRSWTDADLQPLTALNADPAVNVWLGGPGVAANSAAALQRYREQLAAVGWGVLAVCDRDGAILGLAGLQPMAPSLPVAPAVEAVWRLTPAAWGLGYAAEAMRAILGAARTNGAPARVIALVAEPNLRSARTADSLGFRHNPARDFLHPALPEGHWLRAHRVFEQSV